jgi:hypothetical protein
MLDHPRYRSVLAPAVPRALRTPSLPARASWETPEARRLLLLIMAGLVGAATGRAAADTFTVNNILDDGSVGSLRWAIGEANANPGDDAIDFDVGVFAAPQVIALAGTQLELTDTTGATSIAGPAAGVTVDADGLSRVLQVNPSVNASISRMTITGGSQADLFGLAGGIFSLGSVTLTGCTITGNHGWMVGGMWAALGTNTFTDCAFTDNISDHGPGGGLLIDQSSATVTNCTFSGNYAGGWVNLDGVDGGGGLAVTGSSLTMTGCTITDNHAVTSGGGMSISGVYGGSTMVEHCSFRGNTCDGEAFYSAKGGGGVAVSFATATLTDCTINDNSTTGPDGGGGVASSAGDARLVRCTVTGNTATKGAGVSNAPFSYYGYFTPGTSSLTDCTVSGNTASGNGGGVSNDAECTLTVSNCTVNNNTAARGGGINSAGGTATITGSTINSNLASSSDVAQGGGIASENTNLSLINSVFNANRANGATAQGGGIFAVTSTLTADGCTVNGNRANGAALGHGGGVYCLGGIMNLPNSSVKGNRATTAFDNIFSSP